MRKTILTLFLTVTLTVLSVFLSLNHATNSDEAAHIVGGLSIWKYGRFDLYNVNPPLIRMIAALPISLFCEPDIDWALYEEHLEKPKTGSRPEFGMGLDFVRRNTGNLQKYLIISRLACLPFCLLGAYYVRRWAKELYGEWAGLTALTLWCFSPNILTWGSFVMPDLPAASLGIMTCYYFWRWLQIPDKGNTFIAGLTFGLTLLTKLTWIILFPLFPLLCFIWYLFKVEKRSWKSAKDYVFQMVLLLLIAVIVLNFGYGFEGTFTKLGDYQFSSHALTGYDSEYWHAGNRFANTPLKYLPIPFPKNYILGADIQKIDFERGLPSYLNGQWSEHGWWYFYLECLLLKVPLGTLCLGILTIFFLLIKVKLKDSRVNFCDELTLFIPALTLFVFVSSQTGFSVHFRYVLPAFPLAFVAISKVFAIAKERSIYWRVLVFTLLLWSIGNSLSVFPYSMSYFNELIGGSTKGFYYLHGSSIDWGQDALRLKKRLFKYPEIKGLHLTLSTDIAKALFIPENYPIVPMSPGISIDSNEAEEDNDARQLAPRPGWFAISVTQLHAEHGRYQYLLDFEPKYRIGYSINIYHITLDEANK
ncbi:MAG: glycosyltransferase family 39 protein, partial [Planctomycetaceae bacterium]|nr:glycosyltransferase family 39 protein [Planctomycetaceae bacterium]